MSYDPYIDLRNRKNPVLHEEDYLKLLRDRTTSGYYRSNDGMYHVYIGGSWKGDFADIESAADAGYYLSENNITKDEHMQKSKKQICSMQKKIESLSKKCEYSSDTIRIDGENIQIEIVEVTRYDDRFSDNMVPKTSDTYSLLEFKDIIAGLAETSNGYSTVTGTDGEIRVAINVPEENEDGELTDDYNEELIIYCYAKVVSNGLDGIVDYLEGN